MKVLPKRLLSIDIFRAITMLLMIFVNDASGLHHIPAWIDHVEADVDGLGFADTIFPAFLFIVGLSLPLAIRNRRNKGASLLSILLYVLLRGGALLVMGFFHVNMEDYHEEAAVLSRPVWTILVTLSFFLIWLDYPASFSRMKRYALVAIGILLLAAMAYLYKGGHEGHVHGMRPSWWGILGIIGWAYLVCAFLFVLLRGNIYGLLTALVVLLGINITSHAGWLDIYLPVVGDASSESLIMAGAILSVIYTRLAEKGAYRPLWILLLTAGMVLPVLGLLIRPYAGGISKIYATPAWVLICTGISILVLAGVIWLVEVKGKQQWFDAIRPAGSSTLTCYLLPYFLYSLYWLFNFHYPSFFNQGIGGLARSFAVAFILIWVAGKLEKKHIRLKI